MKKAIHIGIIILFLIAICSTEQILAQTYLKETKEKATEILEIFENNETEDLKSILETKTNELDKFWKQKENVLCSFINHTEIEEIGVEITKLKSALEENEKHVYLESLLQIHYYLYAYQHVIGINMQSLF